MTTLASIFENSINRDSNNVEMFIGNELNRHSIDITGNGDSLIIVKYDNEIWAVQDDLQGQHTHFTEDIKTTIESYIDSEDDEYRISLFNQLLRDIEL